MKSNASYQTAALQVEGPDLKVYHGQKLKRKFTKIHSVISHAKPTHHLSGYIRPKKHDHL